MTLYSTTLVSQSSTGQLTFLPCEPKFFKTHVNLTLSSGRMVSCRITQTPQGEVWDFELPCFELTNEGQATLSHRKVHRYRTTPCSALFTDLSAHFQSNETFLLSLTHSVTPHEKVRSYYVEPISLRAEN